MKPDSALEIQLWRALCASKIRMESAHDKLNTARRVHAAAIKKFNEDFKKHHQQIMRRYGKSNNGNPSNAL